MDGMDTEKTIQKKIENIISEPYYIGRKNLFLLNGNDPIDHAVLYHLVLLELERKNPLDALVILKLLNNNYLNQDKNGLLLSMMVYSDLKIFKILLEVTEKLIRKEDVGDVPVAFHLTCLLAIGKYDEILKISQEMMSLHNDPSIIQIIALAYRIVGDLETSERILQELIRSGKIPRKNLAAIRSVEVGGYSLANEQGKFLAEVNCEKGTKILKLIRGSHKPTFDNYFSAGTCFAQALSYESCHLMSHLKYASVMRSLNLNKEARALESRALEISGNQGGLKSHL
ncbi:MAG: hypothetical protein P8Y73_07980 [Desulfuromonadales bacterium]